MQVITLAGSLRAASINAAFCRAAVQFAPAGMSITAYPPGLGTLPLFNPDLEAEPPGTVTQFRHVVGRADALIIASPEYAHGISGVLKNALDWLVSYEGFIGKPVALINTSPRAHHAYDATLEVLRTMSATLIAQACISLPLLGRCTTTDQMIASPEIGPQIRNALSALQALVHPGAQEYPSFPVG
jgi:NAD(P)H-dependent FMN reductase